MQMIGKVVSLESAKHKFLQPNLPKPIIYVAIKSSLNSFDTKRQDRAFQIELKNQKRVISLVYRCTRGV